MRCWPKCPRFRDRAQVVPLFAAVLVVAFALVLVLLQVGVAANDDARAQAAADLTALAAAASDDTAAAEVAAANDAEVLALRRAGSDVSVEVRVGEATATASARREAPARRDGPDVDVTGLHPDLLAAVARAEAIIGRPLAITSGLRTRAEQEQLWRNRHRNPYPVARPGTSAHERGLAIDVSRADLGVLVPISRRVGLCRPLPESDPIHFRLCE